VSVSAMRCGVSGHASPSLLKMTPDFVGAAKMYTEHCWHPVSRPLWHVHQALLCVTAMHTHRRTAATHATSGSTLRLHSTA
jgi:hypothetical protein